MPAGPRAGQMLDILFGWAKVGHTVGGMAFSVADADAAGWPCGLLGAEICQQSCTKRPVSESGCEFCRSSCGTYVITFHTKTLTCGWGLVAAAGSGGCLLLVGCVLDVLLVQMASWRFSSLAWSWQDAQQACRWPAQTPAIWMVAGWTLGWSSLAFLAGLPGYRSVHGVCVHHIQTSCSCSAVEVVLVWLCHFL